MNFNFLAKIFGRASRQADAQATVKNNPDLATPNKADASENLKAKAGLNPETLRPNHSPKNEEKNGTLNSMATPKNQESQARATKSTPMKATAPKSATNRFWTISSVISRVMWNWSLLTLRFVTGGGLFIVVICSCLFFTSFGAEFLLNQVKKLDDGIQFEYVSGHFGHGFVLHNLAIKIPQVLTLEASHLEIDYSLLSLIRGHFDVRKIKGTNVLLVLGQKAKDMPLLVDFLQERLKEVRAFEYDDETLVMKRITKKAPDNSWKIAPLPWPQDNENALTQSANMTATASTKTQAVTSKAEVWANETWANSKVPGKNLTLASQDEPEDKNSTAATKANAKAKTKVETKAATKATITSAKPTTYSKLVQRGPQGALAKINPELYRRETKNALTYAPDFKELVRVGRLQQGGMDYAYAPSNRDNKLATLNRNYIKEEVGQKINLPLVVTLKDVQVHNFLLLSDVLDVAVADVSLSAVFEGGTITLKRGQIGYLDVGLHNERFTDDPNEPADDPELEDKAFTTPFDRDLIIRNVGMLPTVILPFDSVVEKLDLAYGRYHQDGYDTGVMHGQLQASFKGPRIYVERLSVDHELGHAELNKSEIYLTRYYPMHVYLSGCSTNEDYLAALKTHTLEAEGVGDLVDLWVDAKIAGKKPLNDEIKAQVRLASLTPNLPFVAKIEAKKVGFPFKADADYKAKELTVKARGTLDAISYELVSSGVKALKYPAFEVALDGSTNFEAAEITTLNVKTPKVARKVKNGAGNLGRNHGHDSVSYTGLVAWNEGVVSAGTLKAMVADLRAYAPEVKDLRGSIALESDYQMSFFSPDDWAIDLKTLDGHGTYLGHRFNLASKHIALNQDFAGEIDNFVLSMGAKNKISLHGQMQDHINLNGVISLGELEGVWPGLGGNLEGAIWAGGSYASPRAKLNLSSNRVIYEAQRFRDLKLDLEVVTRKLQVTDLTLHAQTGRISANKETLAQNLAIDLVGNEESHTLSAQGSSPFGEVELMLNGGFKHQRAIYQGHVATLKYQRPDLEASLHAGGDFSLKLAPQLAVETKQMVFKVNGNDVRLGESFWQGTQAKTSLTARAIDLMKFKSFLPERVEFSRPVSVVATMGLNKGKLEGQVEVTLPKGHILHNRKILNYENIAVRAKIENDIVSTDLDLNLGAKGQARAEVTLSDPLKNKSLGGFFKVVALDLGGLSAFSNDISSSAGVLNGTLHFGGTTEKPEIRGGLEVTDMSVTTAVDLGTIEHINTVMTFTGTKAQLLSSFYMQERKGTAQGTVSWDPEVEAKIALKTEKLPVNLLGYGQGEIQLDVLSSFVDGVTTVSGTVDVPRARIKVKTLPSSSVSASSDVIKVERAENGAYQFEKTKPLPINLKLAVNVGPDFNINAMGLKTNVSGSINIRQKPSSYTVARGTIFLNDGRFKAYGQNLLIERGRLSFVGDVTNPGVEIRAIRDPHAMEDEDVTVGLMVSGMAQNPQIKLFSEPQMAQSELLSYLMRGRGLEASTEENSDMSTQLLLGLGLMQTSGFIGELAENFGIRDFSLDSKGDGDDTSVEVSGYIMPKIQVAYGYGIYNALSEFRVRYEMFPRFFIEYVSSLEQAVDAVYKFEF